MNTHLVAAAVQVWCVVKGVVVDGSHTVSTLSVAENERIEGQTFSNPVTRTFSPVRKRVRSFGIFRTFSMAMMVHPEEARFLDLRQIIWGRAPFIW